MAFGIGTYRQHLVDPPVSVRNFVCELIYKSQGTRSLVYERPS